MLQYFLYPVLLRFLYWMIFPPVHVYIAKISPNILQRSGLLTKVNVKMFYMFCHAYYWLVWWLICEEPRVQISSTVIEKNGINICFWKSFKIIFKKENQFEYISDELPFLIIWNMFHYNFLETIQIVFPYHNTLQSSRMEQCEH